MKNSWTKEEKATFRTQHPTKYPIKQANHNSPKADVKTFADLIYAADRPEYKGIVTIARRPKGTSTMETVASVPAEQVGEWLSQMHVSADADYYITKAQFKAAQTWDTGELFALNAIWVDIDAHEKASNCPNPEDALSLLSQGLEIWTELPEPNIVVYSGRGFHLIWLIGQCAASLGFMASEISKHIGNAIQNLLTDLQIIGYSVDSGYCSNIAGLTRIPGTFNTHANNYCTCEIRHSVRMSLVCPLIDPVTGNYITIGPLITIHVLKENAALMQVGKPITVFCFPHQMAFYRAALGEEIDFLLASAEGAG